MSSDVFVNPSLNHHLKDHSDPDLITWVRWFFCVCQVLKIKTKSILESGFRAKQNKTKEKPKKLRIKFDPDMFLPSAFNTLHRLILFLNFFKKYFGVLRQFLHVALAVLGFSL